MEENFDVIIMGAGLAGSTLALQLVNSNPELSIAIFTKHSFPLEEGTGTVGESTVEIASHYLANILGLKNHLEEQQLPKLGLRYFLENGSHEKIEDRLEVGGNVFAPTPSYQIDRARLENYIWDTLKSKGVHCAEDTQIKSINLDHLTSHSIEVGEKSPNHSERKTYKCKWIVDASGRTSLLKKQLGLKKRSEHEGSAVWWRMEGEFKIDEWCNNPEWRKNNQGNVERWFSTNHLMGKGYWVWIIPLSPGLTSFGIVTDSSIHPFSDYHTFDKALAWLHSNEPQMATLCEKNRDKLKDFAGFKNYSYSAEKVFSAERWAITGEAGVFIDPFYSPGSDFIALSNTYITDLISRETKGENIKFRGSFYNDLFLSFAESTYSTYQKQYEILGNPLVLPIKIFWDWCFYWHFLARLFFDNKIFDLNFIAKEQKSLEELRLLSHHMQKTFYEWNKAERPTANPGFLDLGKHSYLMELNRSLSCPSEDNSFEKDKESLKSIAKEVESIIESRSNEVELPDGPLVNFYKDLLQHLN